jgi:hypothetical protein
MTEAASKLAPGGSAAAGLVAEDESVFVLVCPPSKHYTMPNLHRHAVLDAILNASNIPFFCDY